MKLHLGCGSKKIHGWVNVDTRADVNPDIVDDITVLDSIKDGSVDIIYACHVLEHIHKTKVLTTLKKWHSKLRNWDSKLRISVPDFDAVIKVYGLTKNPESIQSFLTGGGKYTEDVHHTIWNSTRLTRQLQEAGFNFVVPWNWKEVEHGHIDDYSQAYLPHMDKVNGILMSLNVEADKSFRPYYSDTDD